jgi:hypothetical protein
MTLPNFKLKIVAKEPTCADATVNLNGNSFLSVDSGQTVNVELVDQSDDAITPISVVSNKITVQVGEDNGLPEINLNLNYTGNGSLFDFLT